MVVTLHDHITSLVVFCNMYLCLINSDVKAPQLHGKIMEHIECHTENCVVYLTSDLLELYTISGR